MQYHVHKRTNIDLVHIRVNKVVLVLVYIVSSPILPPILRESACGYKPFVCHTISEKRLISGVPLHHPVLLGTLCLFRWGMFRLRDALPILSPCP